MADHDKIRAFLAAATVDGCLFGKMGSKAIPRFNRGTGGTQTMNEQDNNLVPQQTDGEGQDLAIEPTGAPEEFGFPEKPTMAQSKRWASQERFLKELARTGLLCHSADVAGVTPQAVEQWRHEVTTNGRSLLTFNFPKRFEMALARYNERLDAEIDRRGIEGVDKPLVFRGQITTDEKGKPVTIKEYSDNLLMFKKKKLDPAYRDNWQPPQGPTTINVKETIIHVIDSRNQGGIIEGLTRKIPAEGPSQQAGEGDKSA